MTPSSALPDETLVAFLDGELNPADRQTVQDRLDSDAGVAGRLAFLQNGDLPFAAAFDGLLAEAPIAKLRAMALDAAASDAAPGARGFARSVDRRWLLAAACLAAGVVLDRSAAVLTGGREGDGGNWRDVIANYMMLYAPETLTGSPSGAGPTAREMARLSDEIGVDLSLPKVDIPGTPVRRAQMLRYQGAPLVQIAYLDRASGPLAFCLIRKDGNTEAPRGERRLGMNIVHWSTPTHAFLVIGHGEAAALESIAAGLREHMAG